MKHIIIIIITGSPMSAQDGVGFEAEEFGMNCAGKIKVDEIKVDEVGITIKVDEIKVDDGDIIINDTVIKRKSGADRVRVISNSSRQSSGGTVNRRQTTQTTSGVVNRRRAQTSGQQIILPNLKRKTSYPDDDLEEQPLTRNNLGLNLGIINLFYTLGGWKSNGFHYALQYGHLFHPNLGLNLQYFANSFVPSVKTKETLQYDGLLLGPLIAVPLSRARTAELFIKPAAGFGRTNSTSAVKTTGNKYGVGMSASLGLTLGINLSPHIALSANFDLYYGKIKDQPFLTENFSGAATTVGLSYRF
ncbi:MAG: porin family protein [Tannerella sp.]|jgi:hypothetical protein|nr:porin family protein [Tannerella sp.]